MADALAAVAAGWGVLMALAPLLQMRRVLERRSSADISISYLAEDGQRSGAEAGVHGMRVRRSSGR